MSGSGSGVEGKPGGMSQPFTVACVQTTSGTEVAANIVAASALVRDAAADGADFVLLPETVNIMDPRNKRMFEKIAPEGGDECLKAFRALAQETSIWLLAGSLVVKDSAPPPEGERAKAVNRSFLIDPEGGITARYDKIHMFDVDLGDGEVHKESKAYAAGADNGDPHSVFSPLSNVVGCKRVLKRLSLTTSHSLGGDCENIA